MFCLAFSSSFIFVYIRNALVIDCPVEIWEKKYLWLYNFSLIYFSFEIKYSIKG